MLRLSLALRRRTRWWVRGCVLVIRLLATPTTLSGGLGLDSVRDAAGKKALRLQQRAEVGVATREQAALRQ
jgi:hypothetical protein